MHPCVSSIGLWAISAGGIPTRAPPSACRPRRAPLGWALSILPMNLEESIYYALLLYSPKRSGPSGGIRTHDPEDQENLRLSLEPPQFYTH